MVDFISNRVKSRWVLSALAIIWAATQFPMLGMVSLATLYVCRIVLGAGEGPAYTMALHAAYKWFPNERRSLPTSIILVGMSAGVGIAMPVLAWICRQYSWHWAFGVLGFAGVAWVLAWILLGKEGTLPINITVSDGKTYDRVPYANLFLNGTTIAVILIGFGFFWSMAVLISWFPPYLIQGLRFSSQATGWLSTLPWICQLLVALGAGWLTQRMVVRGVSTRIARGVLCGVCVVIAGLALILAPYMPNVWLTVAMLVIGLSFSSAVPVTVFVVMSEYTPATQRGAATSCANALCTTAGLFGPYVMGVVIQNAATKIIGYERGFIICGIIALVCGIFGIIFLRPEAERDRFAVLQSKIKPVEQLA